LSDCNFQRQISGEWRLEGEERRIGRRFRFIPFSIFPRTLRARARLLLYSREYIIIIIMTVVVIVVIIRDIVLIYNNI